jgi:DNA (cytosine-5)-methyltransferase 1
MNLQTASKPELLSKCRELGIKKYSNKTKPELIEMMYAHISNNQPPIEPVVQPENIEIQNEYIHIETETNVLRQSLSTITPNKPLKFIDLFCGIGGFHQAMRRFGGECVFASDIDESCRFQYEKNYGLKPAGDISTLDITTIPEFDVLCGGFPCQSFSNSGKKGGLSDKRGKLFEYILQIADLRKPSFMILENVKHIRKIDGGKAFTHIVSRIRETGYSVETIDISPHQLGVPQQRERVVFICVRMDIYKSPIFENIPSPDIPITARTPERRRSVGVRGLSGEDLSSKDNLEPIFERDPAKTQKYHISKDDERILEAWDEMIQVFETGESLSPTILCNEFYRTYSPAEFAGLPEWKRDYITKNRPLYEKYKVHWDAWYAKHRELLNKKEIYGKLEWQTGKKKAGDSIFHHFIQMRQSGIRVKRSEYFPTLVAIVQTPIYAKERRHITPRECARLQSFPDDFIIHENDHTAYKQFGNAVNVEVVFYVLQNVFRAYGIIL